MTYDELVTNIRNYTEVGSNVFTEPVINVFITMAENQILREIDLDVFKLEVTGSMTQGNKFLAAPADLLTHRYMILTPASGDQLFLDFRDTSFMKEYWANGTTQGTPKYYSVWDQNTFYIAPTPNQNYSVELGYIYRPTQLNVFRRLFSEFANAEMSCGCWLCLFGHKDRLGRGRQFCVHRCTHLNWRSDG